MRVAIAEPDPAVADLLVFVAQRRGHQPVCVSNAGRLFDRLPFAPSVAIVNFDRLDSDDLSVIARLHHEFPDMTLLVTAEKVKDPGPSLALLAGANDVIRSPFNPNEVILRAESWYANRGAGGGKTDTIRVADLEIDLGFYSAVKAGQPITFTKLELRLLYCLCEHFPNLAPIERMLAFGWESPDEPDATLVKTHVSHIRKKLRDAGGVPFEITSRQTVGYTLTVAQ